MAWHIPKEMMNNKPLSEEEVRKRYSERGLTIIDFTYKNNRTKMLCYDSEGYKVKVSLDTFHAGTKIYARFSPIANLEGFMYNINHYRELNPNCPEVIDWKYIEVGKNKKKQIRLKCACLECGEVFWLSTEAWKRGVKTRCNKCVNIESSLELIVRKWLESNNISFISQYRFKDCRNKKPLPFDFYLPDFNMCIEIDGEQHYKIGAKIKCVKFTKEDVERVQANDQIKTEYCIKNNIELLRIPYYVFHTEGKFEQILKSKLIINKD